MTLSKKQREKLFSMFGGRCAYCGCELKRGWHADHVIRVHRYRKRVGWDAVNNKHIYENLMTYPEFHNIANLMPACRSCNLYKSTMDLEVFRAEVGKLIERLNARFNQYKIAKRFGLVKETGAPVKFLFEMHDEFEIIPTVTAPGTTNSTTAACNG